MLSKTTTLTHLLPCFLLSQSAQKTVTRDGQETELRARGRHDPCVVPRAVPMVEAMVALVLADALMQHHAQCNLLPPLLPRQHEVTREATAPEEAALFSEH